jgi:hypothetical protein
VRAVLDRPGVDAVEGGEHADPDDRDEEDDCCHVLIIDTEDYQGKWIYY